MNLKTPNNYQQKQYIPRGLLFQWHITEHCNLRCAHCYQDDYSGRELGFEDLLEVLKQFEDLLEIFSAKKKYYSFAILTNGTFINSTMAGRLRELGPSFVQVSIEGIQATHDRIRGQGNFERTVNALKHLVRERVRTLISFTAHRDNFREFTEIAKLGQRLRVSRVWADRLIPWGTGSALKERVLTPEETREFFEIMHNARTKAARSWLRRTEISMHRALQFLVGGGKPYHCTAGDTLITVQPNGDLYPCRRMPIRVGNLLEIPLIDLYYNSELFLALRNRQIISDGCQDCSYSRLCRGGLKCLSYAVEGDSFKADPGCWLASVKQQMQGPKMASGSKS